MTPAEVDAGDPADPVGAALNAYRDEVVAAVECWYCGSDPGKPCVHDEDKAPVPYVHDNRSHTYEQRMAASRAARVEQDTQQKARQAVRDELAQMPAHLTEYGHGAKEALAELLRRPIFGGLPNEH